MRNNRRKNNIIIAGLCSILVIMGVGYAAFASQLKITGSSKISSNWDIEITNIRSTNSYSYDSETYSSTAYDITKPTYTPTTANFSAGLKVPGDFILYEAEVSNLGTIDGQVTVTSLSCGDNEAIYCYSDYSVSEKEFDDDWNYNGIDSNWLEEGTNDLTTEAIKLSTKDKMYIYIMTIYNPNVTSQPDNLSANISLTLNYQQYDSSYETMPLMMSRDTKAFWQYDYREKISSIDIVTTNSVPSNAVESWDVSQRQNKTVMAYIIDDSSNSGMYKLYIGGEGGVIAPANSEELFGSFKKITTINGLENLDTSNVTNMSWMFDSCNSLTSLDVSKFNTSKVTNIGDMFQGCDSLTSLDLSSFDTSNVTDMYGMFNRCEGLTKLNLCNFNTSKVTYMDYMFSGTDKITQITVGSNWTTANATTTGMFNGSGVSSVTTGQC